MVSRGDGARDKKDKKKERRRGREGEGKGRGGEGEGEGEGEGREWGTGAGRGAYYVFAQVSFQKIWTSTRWFVVYLYITLIYIILY